MILKLYFASNTYTYGISMMLVILFLFYQNKKTNNKWLKIKQFASNLIKINTLPPLTFGKRYLNINFDMHLWKQNEALI